MAGLCIEEIRTAVGGRLDDVEIANLMDVVEAKLGTHKNYRRHINDQDEALRLMNQLKEETQKKAILNMANRVKKNRVVAEFIDFVNTNDLDFADAIDAKIGGQYKGTIGEGLNYDSRFNAYMKTMMGDFDTGLDKLNLRKVLKGGRINRLINKELWELRPDGKPGITGNKDALEIAKLMRKSMDYSLEIQNRAGAYISKVEGYQGPQFHDSAIINKIGRAEWKQDIMGKLDMEETMGDVNVTLDEYLDVVYDDILTGKIQQYEDPFVLHGMAGDVIQRATKKRKLIFKDADSYWDYNKKYGSGEDITKNLQRTIETSAKTTSILELFGPSPKAFIDDVMRYAKNAKRGDVKAVDRLKAKEKGLYNISEVMTGEAMSVGNQSVARWGTSIRALNSASKLGSATISQIADVSYAANAMSINGASFLGQVGKQLTGFLSGRRKGFKRELLNGIGIVAESWNGSVFNRLNPGDTIDGRMANMANALFKYSGMNWINDTNRASFGLALSNYLGNNRRTSWKKLNKDLQRELGRFNITESKWNIIRKSAEKSADGKWWVSPDYIRNIDNGLIKSEMKFKTETEVAKFKHDMEIDMASYFHGQVDDAIFMPGVRETYIQTAGKGRGTFLGEVARFFMQFKSFPLMAVRRGLVRTWNTKGLMGTTNLLLWTTAFGFVASTTKDLIGGRKPKDIKKTETWVNAFAQGGALGIYADLLVNARTTYGSGALGTLAGPTGSTFEQSVRMMSKLILDQDADSLDKDALRLIKTNIPFQNLWYTRLLVDHFIMNELQEAVSPGYKARKENWATKEYNQEYWLSPTEGLNL